MVSGLCNKSLSEVHSQRIFKCMANKLKIPVFKTDGYINLSQSDRNFKRGSRTLSSIAKKLVDPIEYAKTKVEPGERFYIFVQLLWDEKSNKHSTVIEGEYSEDGETELFYFDSNGVLDENYPNDVKVMNILDEVCELVPGECTWDEVQEENINKIKGGNCDALAIYYVKQSYTNGFESAKFELNNDITLMGPDRVAKVRLTNITAEILSVC